MSLTVSVCIACYKNDPFLVEAVTSCRMQDYKDIGIVVYHDDEGVGTGEAFNRAIKKAIGDIVILLCSDDVFTCPEVVSDIVKVFETSPQIGHVSRWYHQFVENDRRPVRAWRGKDIVELANNPSGLAFRASALQANSLRMFPGGINYCHPKLELTNRMFVEVAQMVHDITKNSWFYSILEYDTVAVRIHKSISRTPGYYKKMWTSSPVEEWAKLGWKSTDYTHLIQVAVNFERKAVWNEILAFVHVDIWNVFNPVFWFFSLVALATPRVVLYRIPEIYRATIGRWTTREVKRP